jgi:group II intron reverse transcriptase/maturase
VCLAFYEESYGNGGDETKRKAVTGMKTDKLLARILEAENLNQAFKQVKRNKGASGVDEMKINELKEHLSENGEKIKEQIRTRKYKPSPVRRVEIPKPDGGIRNLGVPTVTDRFIQQAVAQVLTPIYEEQFHENSYGFRPNRCAQMAIIKSLELMNDGYTWIVDIDLEKFFDTVNHDKLMQLISETVQDGDVISLIRKFLVSGIMIDNEYKASIIGTQQGGLCRARHNEPYVELDIMPSYSI